MRIPYNTTSLWLTFFFALVHPLEAADPISEDALKVNVFAVTNRLLVIFPAASIQLTNATIVGYVPPDHTQSAFARQVGTIVRQGNRSNRHPVWPGFVQ